tara:strand:+ start:385 stop:1101 length:717 start_codon:yes stop_codon:yes gene_type:complete
MADKTLILLPTLNEANNLKKLYFEIKNINLENDILIIDDGSTDSTIEDISLIIKDNPEKNFSILRGQRKGIGSAHIQGIKWAYEKKYDFIITMDTDFAHNPKYIRELIKYRSSFDVVLGSRYLMKHGVPQWSIFRKILSYGAHIVSFYLFRHDFDSTNSFRCYNLKKIDKEFLNYCNYKHYEFFFTSITVLNIKKYKIFQFPMVIQGRQEGFSKMYLKHMIRSIFFIFYFYLKLKKIN